MTVLNIKNNSNTLFFGETLGIQRYDMIKYRQIEKLFDKQLGFFWRPEEVDLSKDSKDFKDLSSHEKHIFISNIRRQIILDSLQGRSPSLAFLPLVSSPELENWITLWTFNESIHSRSYTHIIRNIFSNPSIVFDEMAHIPEIVDCADEITKYYDNLIDATKKYDNKQISLYELKKHLWLCLNAVNALEGVRFYVSFACSWAFAELNRMEGNAKIIKLIARDENLHLAFTQNMLKLLPSDDSDFEKIKNECSDEVLELFKSVVEQEKEWAKYLFKDGSIIGLNYELLAQYVEYTAQKRLNTLGYKSVYKQTSNPLPWTNSWIGGHDVQVAPQQTQITAYTIGGTVQDVTTDMLMNLKL